MNNRTIRERPEPKETLISVVLPVYNEVERTVNLETDTVAQDDSTGDEPYLELIEQAVHLLQAGTILEDSNMPAEYADAISEPIVFPPINGRN